jgi:hypothetical protein
MTALQQLTRKATSPAERQSAMVKLTIDKAITSGQIKDALVLRAFIDAGLGKQSPPHTTNGRACNRADNRHRTLKANPDT